MKIKTIEGVNPHFDKEVNKLLKDGWTACSDVTHINKLSYDVVYFYQQFKKY